MCFLLINSDDVGIFCPVPDIATEIDLICLDKDCLVFIEVRLRKAISLVSGVHSISRSKKSLLRRSALAYLNRIQKHPKTYRFDIISIAYEQSKGYEISHYRNVALF